MRQEETEPRHREIWMGTGLAIVVVLVQLPIFDRMVIPMDEGHLTAAVSWMLDGKHLYRDIHTGIFPGIYLVTQALFALFGQDLLVTRLAAVVVNVGTALSLWRISARTTNPHWAWLTPAFYIGLLPLGFPVLSMFNYSTLSVALGLGALLFQLRYLEKGRILDGALLGAMIAFTALTKQNFGGLAFIALLVGIVWAKPTSALRELGWIKTLLPIAVAGLLPTLAVVAGFVASGTFGDLIDSTVLSLGGSQIKDFNNPIPPIFGAHPEDSNRFTFLYTPPALFNALLHGKTLLGVSATPVVRSIAIRLSYGVPIFALALAAMLLVRDTFAPGDDERRATRSTVVYAIIFFPGIFPSAIFSHLAFVLIPVLAIYTILLHRINAWISQWGGRDSSTSNIRHVVPALTAAGLLVWGAAAVQASYDVMAWNSVPLELERGTLKVSERQAGLLKGAVSFIDGCAADGASIFVAPDIPVVYFLTDRGTPQPHDLMIPGNVDGPMIARRLDQSETNCVVFNPQMYPEFPPFDELFPHLAGYLSTNFTQVETIKGGQSEWYGLIRTPRQNR